MNILHSKTNPALLERFKEMLGSTAKADIAVGYFFMSGFEAVAPELSRLKEIRILVGRTDRHVLEEVAAGVQQAEALQARLQAAQTIRRSDQAHLAAQTVQQIGEGVARMPQTKGSEDAIALMRDLVASKRLMVHAYLRSTLHAKAYLCWYENHAEPGSAIVGSSNFTLAGFTGNTELNVRVTGDAEMAELKKWFEDLWKDSTDISDQVLVELQRSWPLAKTPPYHVYIKTLYELYGDEVAGGRDIEPPRRSPELPNFQLDAVRRGLRMIELHDGCFVGDVVGLGKTFVGAEILRQLRLSYPRDGQPLIVCPAGLMPMWERTSELFGLGAEVISMSSIAPPPAAKYDEELEEYVDGQLEGPGVVLQDTYPNRGPVLVDEAHNFRNLSRRYAALSSYLGTGDHKVVLMSATPQNLGPRDIYRQLRLFLDETEHGLKIEPLALEDFFAAVQAWYEYRAEFENWQEEYRHWQAQGSTKTPPPDRPKEPKSSKAEIEQVLSPVFIRRRRKDIKELYGDNIEIGGKKIRFPDPKLENLEYRLDRVYAKAGAFADLQRQLRSHKASRYCVTDYIKAEARAKPQYRDLFRARDRVARLMGALLAKRLESSVAAFRSTLDSLMQSNRNFKMALEKGFVPIGQTATRMLQGDSLDLDEMLEILAAEEERRVKAGEARSKLVHPVADFDIARWRNDLDADFTLLSNIAKSVRDIKPIDDDKLQVLKRFLAKPEVKGGKLLIFSEAEVTVDYLYEQLNPGEKDGTIGKLSGANRDHLTDIVKRFAPKANPPKKGEVVPGPEIRVLIATDVVSEGQNLQDCGRVLNYDLHWNPVRLIQRFGRVDRIGTDYEVIHLHNTWPDLDIDANLNLTSRLLNRIQTFHDFIGLDSKLLSDKERLNPKAMYRIYKDKKLPELDDGLDQVASHQRAVSLLQRLQAEDPELWKIVTSLPDGIRSALDVPTPPQPDPDGQRFAQGVMKIEGAQLPMMSPSQETGVESPFDAPGAGETVVLLSSAGVAEAYAVDSRLKSRPISTAQLLTAVECEKDTPAATLPEDTNERVMTAYRSFRGHMATHLGKARRPGSDTRVRRYVSKFLNLARQDFKEDAQKLQRIGILQQIFLGHVPSVVLPELREIRDMQLAGDGLIVRLEALRERYRLSPPEEGEGELPAEAEVVRIVCSDGLTRQ